jgi:lipase chaperone LimK
MPPLLFHKDVFLPEFAQLPLFEGKLTYSRHARNVTQEHAAMDAIVLPAVFAARNATLIEAELNPATGQVDKQVWRQPLDARRDLCFAMLAGGFVKTCWVNDRTDTHATLQRGKYVRSHQWRAMKNKLPAP